MWVWVGVLVWTVARYMHVVTNVVVYPYMIVMSCCKCSLLLVTVVHMIVMSCGDFLYGYDVVVW